MNPPSSPSIPPSHKKGPSSPCVSSAPRPPPTRRPTAPPFPISTAAKHRHPPHSTMRLPLLVGLLPLTSACVNYQAWYGCTASDLDFHASITDNGQVVCTVDASSPECGPDYCEEYAMQCLPTFAAWVTAPDGATVHYHAHGTDFAWQANVMYNGNPYGCPGGAWWDVWVYC